jgi:hypothetical protein
VRDSKFKKRSFFLRSLYPRIFGLLLLVILLVAVPLIALSLMHRQQTAPHQATPTAAPAVHTSPALAPTSPAGTTTPGAGNQAVLSVEVSILDNIMHNGYNAHAPGGGLWVNWRYGTNPLQTNINGSGAVAGMGDSHDPLTDIRYLHNLWLYTSQHPGDTRYASEIARYTPIVKAEFGGTTNQRGWLFDEEFMALFSLSHDSFYRDTAIGMAAGFAKAIDPAVGIIYKKNSVHPQGYYRPSDDLEAACALIMAGTLYNHPDWVQQGQAMLHFLYAHAYIPTYHTFADQMDQVLTPEGGVNPGETFYTSKFRNYTVHGNQLHMGSISQMIISLLHTYQVTHTQNYLARAEDLLTPFTLPANALGIWDTSQLGYFASITFTGTSPQQPGALKIASDKKEAGRQMLMLWALHLANQFTGNRFQEMEKQMLKVALSKAYYAPGHGVMYEVRPDWTPLAFPNQAPANVVTTEAMGIELESLFSLS